MFNKLLVITGKVLVSLIETPLEDCEDEIYQPSSKSIATGSNGETVVLHGSSQGWQINEDHLK